MSQTSIKSKGKSPVDSQQSSIQQGEAQSYAAIAERPAYSFTIPKRNVQTFYIVLCKENPIIYFNQEEYSKQVESLQWAKWRKALDEEDAIEKNQIILGRKSYQNENFPRRA